MGVNVEPVGDPSLAKKQPLGVPNISYSTEVKPDGKQPSWDAEQQLKDRSIWTDFMVYSAYEKDRHVYITGLTSPGGFQGNSCAAVKMSTSTEVLVCSWTAARWDTPPEVPDPASLDSSWVLLDDWWTPAPITTGVDGVTPLYRISGVFVYGCLNPSILTHKDVVFPLMPWLAPEKFPVRYMPDAYLVDDILQTTRVLKTGNPPLNGIPIIVK